MTSDHKLRTTFIFLLFCLLYLIVLFNLYTIQIKQNDFFLDLARKQYYVTLTTMPPRAEIFDRHGITIALNQDQLSAFILPKEIKQPTQLNSFLKKHFPATLSRLTTTKSHFLYIKRKLTDEQINLIKQAQLEDIYFLKEPSRYYPLLCASPLLGITNIDNVGLFGIEQLFNERLAGKSTTHQLEKDARSGHFYFKKETKIEGQKGEPVTLTIDSDLQFLTYEELKQTVDRFKAQEGSILIMDPTNGHLLVMANYPAFDPHNTTNLNQAYTKNKIVTEVHEPGSVMKVFLALAALEEGVVTPDELIDCEGKKIATVNGVRFSTWRADEIIPFSDVIAFSNNVGVAKVALRLGPTLYDHYCKVGFGSKSSLEWPGEQKGFVNPPQKWSRPSIISLSFGYEITISLLQLARAFSIIANGGYLIQPVITLNPAQETEQGAAPLYSQTTLEVMRTILEKAVAHGTGKQAAIKDYKIMGKTGTANLAINGSYSTQHNIYTFVGIIEKGSYKRVVVTFVKDSPLKDIYASTVAAPLFERVTEKMLIHEKII
jgi:cell division protein FtsI (penicillin-binding protein 3)